MITAVLSALERLNLNNVAEVESRASSTCFAEMEQRLEETPHKRSAVWGKEIVETGVPTGRALKRINKTYTMKRLAVFAMMLTMLFAVEAQESGHKCCQKKGGCCQQAKTEKCETMAVEEFSQRMMSKSVVLVDVRTPKEYAEGHLQGATNIAWCDDFEKQWDAAGIKKSFTVAVYCRSGRRSSVAASALMKKGYKVIELKGGILAWEKAGKPVVK